MRPPHEEETSQRRKRPAPSNNNQVAVVAPATTFSNNGGIQQQHLFTDLAGILHSATLPSIPGVHQHPAALSATLASATRSGLLGHHHHHHSLLSQLDLPTRAQGVPLAAVVPQLTSRGHAPSSHSSHAQPTPSSQHRGERFGHYQDYSLVPPDSSTTNNINTTTTNTLAANNATAPTSATSEAKDPPFPVKLHRILSSCEHEEYITWLPHGRAWRVIKPKAFEEKVIPLHFRHAKYASFMRQVNGWGFRRVIKGPDRNSYYHELFLRGLPHLCHKMQRPSKGAGSNTDKSSGSDHHNMSSHPDFTRLSLLRPVPNSQGVFPGVVVATPSPSLSSGGENTHRPMLNTSTRDLVSSSLTSSSESDEANKRSSSSTTNQPPPNYHKATSSSSSGSEGERNESGDGLMMDAKNFSSGSEAYAGGSEGSGGDNLSDSGKSDSDPPSQDGKEETNSNEDTQEQQQQQQHSSKKKQKHSSRQKKQSKDKSQQEMIGISKTTEAGVSGTHHHLDNAPTNYPVARTLLHLHSGGSATSSRPVSVVEDTTTRQHQFPPHHAFPASLQQQQQQQHQGGASLLRVRDQNGIEIGYIEMPQEGVQVHTLRPGPSYFMFPNNTATPALSQQQQPPPLALRQQQQQVRHTPLIGTRGGEASSSTPATTSSDDSRGNGYAGR